MAGSKRFLMHSAFLVGMIEKALNMLGTDDEELTMLMSELGRKHVVYGGTFFLVNLAKTELSCDDKRFSLLLFAFFSCSLFFSPPQLRLTTSPT